MELLDAFPDKSMDDFVVDTAHNSPLVSPSPLNVKFSTSVAEKGRMDGCRQQ